MTVDFLTELLNPGTMTTKNNGIMLTGINIRQAHTMVTPTIYINDFYREDVDKKEIDNIVLKIKRIYQGRCKENPVGEEVKNYLDFDWVSERIFYTLINHSMIWRLYSVVFSISVKMGLRHR